MSFWDTAEIGRQGNADLIGVFAYKTASERHEHDLEVEAKGPVPNIEDVKFDPSGDGRVPAPAVDLGPSRYPRLHFMTQHVLGHLFPKLLDEHGSFRSWTDDGHVALYNIDELR